MSAIIESIVSVEPYGETLSVVTTSGGHQVIANKREDGSFRWTPGEPVCYVGEGSIIPDDVLRERGYWDEEKDRGLLDGGKRNRVKMKKLAGFESRGLLFKVMTNDLSGPEGTVGYIVRSAAKPELQEMYVGMDEDVGYFFDLTEFTG